MKTHRIAALAFAALACRAAGAQDALRTPLPPTHPLIGTWHADLPKLECFEEYEIRADGTKSSMSGEERNQSEFEISPAPTPAGYYRWIDRITGNNGKPDCTGNVTPVGDVAENYVLLHPSGDRFLLCAAQDMNSCFAEFKRKRD